MANPKPAPLKIGVEPAGVFGMTGFLLGLLISLWNWCEFWFLQGLLLGHCKWKKIKTDKDKKFLRDHPFKTPANFSSFLDPYPYYSFFAKRYSASRMRLKYYNFLFFSKKLFRLQVKSKYFDFLQKVILLNGFDFLCEKPFRLMGEIKKKYHFLQKVIPLNWWDWNIIIFSFFGKSYSNYQGNHNILIFFQKDIPHNWTNRNILIFLR